MRMINSSTAQSGGSRTINQWLMSWFLILVSSYMIASRPAQAEDYPAAESRCHVLYKFALNINQQGNGKTKLRAVNWLFKVLPNDSVTVFYNDAAIVGPFKGMKIDLEVNSDMLPLTGDESVMGKTITAKYSSGKSYTCDVGKDPAEEEEEEEEEEEKL